MDRDTISALTHAGLPFANPLDPAAIDAAIAALDLPARARALDIGCGAGELLARVQAAHPGVETHGVEPSATWAQAARDRGVDHVHQGRWHLDGAAGTSHLDLVACVASSHAIGTWDEALRVMHGLTRPGGTALVGEGFWARTPTPGYLEALGGATADELPDHDGLLEGARAAGWSVEAEHVASQEDWRRYEEHLLDGGERAHAEQPDPDLRAWIDAARARWNHPDGRDTLGFALLTLRRGG